MTDPAQDEFPAPPASPLAAFVGELAGRAQAGGLRVLLAALEHVLNQQSWAREKLRAHAGRTVRLGLAAPPIASLPAPELFARITADGVLEPADAGAEASASMLLVPSPSVLVSMVREGPEGVARHVRIDGEAMLVATLGELARHLRWDVEEDLSRIVGDVAAHRLASAARQGVQGLAEIGQRAQSAAAQFVGSGQPPVVARRQAVELRAGLDELEQRTRGLEARVERLRGGA